MPNLTSVKEKLLDCAKNKKPVLLYGKDTIGRKSLVMKIHKMAIQADAPSLEKDPEIPIPVKAFRDLINRSAEQHYICKTMAGKELKEIIKDLFTGRPLEIQYPAEEEIFYPFSEEDHVPAVMLDILENYFS